MIISGEIKEFIKNYDDKLPFSGAILIQNKKRSLKMDLDMRIEVNKFLIHHVLGLVWLLGVKFSLQWQYVN